MSYEVIYRLPFTDDAGNTKRIDLLQLDFAGSITEADGVGYSPVFTSLEGQNSQKQRTLWGTELVANLFSKTDFEFLDLLKTASEREFRLELYENSTLKHAGYVIPDSVSEAYDQAPYAVRVGAVSLGALQGIQYKDGSDFYEGRTDVLTVVTRCLNKLDFGFDIWDSVNTYEDAMDSASSDSPLTQADVDQDSFIFTERGRTKALNCYEVLERVLKPFVVNLFQDNGAWKIIPIELRGQSRTVRIFNSSGALQSTTTHDPEDTTYDWVNRGANLRTLPALREIESVYDHGIIPNLIEEGGLNNFVVPDSNFPFFSIPDGWELSDEADFEESFPNQGASRIAVDPEDGGPYGLLLQGGGIEDDAYIFVNPSQVAEFQEDDTVRLKIRYAPQVLGAPQEIASIKIRFRIGVNYLQADGSWTTTATDIEILDIGDAETQIFPGVSGFRDFEFISEPIEADGDIEFRIYKPESSESANDTNCAYAFAQGDYFPDGFPQTQSKTYVGTREIDSFAEEVDYELNHGDGPTNIHASAFTVDDSKTESWDRGALSGGISQVAIRAIAGETQLPHNVITGTQRTSGTFDRYFTDQGTKYIVGYGQYDERKNYMQGNYVEQFESSTTISITEFDEQQTGSSGGSGGSSGEVGNFDDRYLRIANNLGDLDSVSTALDNLGLGSTDDVTFKSGTFSDLTSGRVVFAGASGLLTDSANFLFDGTDVDLPSATFGTNHALTGSLGDARYGRLGSANTWTANNVFENDVIVYDDDTFTPLRIRRDVSTDFYELRQHITNTGQGQVSLRINDTTNLSSLFFNNGSIDVGLGNFQMGGTTVIDSSRNAFFAEGTFSGTLDVDGLASLDGGIDVDGAFTVANTSGNIATTGTLDVTGIATFGNDIEKDNFALTTDFSGTGWQGSSEGDFNIRNLVVRESARFRELIIDELSIIAGSDLRSVARGKIQSVDSGANTVVLENPNDKTASEWVDNDFFWCKAVDVDGGTFLDLKGQVTDVDVTAAVITLTLDTTVTGGTHDGGTTDISSLSQGNVLVQRGHPSNTDRQALIYTTVSDSDAPVQKYFTGIDSLDAFDAVANISTQIGVLDGLTSTYANVTGEGFFSANAYLTDSILIGDLSKAGNYMEFASGSLDVQAESFLFETTNMTIDSANELIEIGTAHVLDGANNEVSFSNGILTADDTEVELASFTADSDSITKDEGSGRKIIMGEVGTAGTPASGFGITANDDFSGAGHFVRMFIDPSGGSYGFQARDTNGDVVARFGSTNFISELEIAGDLTFGEDGRILGFDESDNRRFSMSRLQFLLENDDGDLIFSANTQGSGAGEVAIGRNLFLRDFNTDTSAAAGSASSLPATPELYIPMDVEVSGSPVRVMVPAYLPDTSPPSSPSQPSVCKTGNALIVSWSAVGGADTYRVERTIDGGAWETVTSGTTSTSVGDTTPAGMPDDDVNYRVSACSEGAGCSSPSTPSTTTTFNSATAC